MYMNWTLPMTVDRLHADCASKLDEARLEALVPRADIIDTGEVYKVVVEMPGVSRENLSIELEDDTLTLRGTRQATADESQLLVNGRRADRPYVRQLTLGNEIDRSRIQARLDNGLVTVTLPRREEVKPVKIEVQADS